MSKHFSKCSEEWFLLLNDLTSRLRLWSNEHSVFAPRNAISRSRLERSPFIIAKAFVGLFLTPKRNFLGEVEYILEGLRNVEYIKNYPPSTVLILGSWSEANFAKSVGYKFYWSFPIECSLILKKVYNINLFINYQFSVWSKALILGNKKFVLLYEDTQPQGCFFAALTKHSLLNSNCKAICIQHGYFSDSGSYSIVDGSFTEFNFVWDVHSIKLIGCDPLKSFDIGPQFQLRPLNRKLSKVIFVGLGSNYDGTSDYEYSLEYFHKIIHLVNSDLRSKLVYRPHPCELSDKKSLNKLHKLFENVEYPVKGQILTKERHVFVGSHSSLLFEAAYCGHVVIILSICKGIVFTVNTEFNFRDVQEELVAQQINKLLMEDSPVFPEIRLPQYSFRSAIRKIHSY